MYFLWTTRMIYVKIKHENYLKFIFLGGENKKSTRKTNNKMWKTICDEKLISIPG